MTWPEAVRAVVRTRANSRCEYCLLSEDDAGLPHEIDHVLSRKHGGTDGLDNLAYACYLCNRFKGSDIASVHPITGELVRFFDPRQDAWREHFSIEGSLLTPLTEIGLVTALLLRFNSPPRIIERQLLQTLGRYQKS